MKDIFKGEVLSLIEELELIPNEERQFIPYQKLTEDGVIAIVEELWSVGKRGEGFVMVESDQGRFFVDYGNLPLVSIHAGYRLNESEDGINSITKAVNEINLSWGLVKAFLDPEKENVMIMLDAYHKDIASFKQNVLIYVSQVLKASKAFLDKFDEYESERMLKPEQSYVC